LEKEAEHEISKVATLSSYKVIDRAYGSSRPIGPSSKNILIVAIILGLVFGTIFAFILDFLDSKIKTIDEIEKQVDIPIYGVVPFVKNRKVQLELYNSPNSPFTESYRKLRINLQLEAEEKIVILITSTVDGEGKNLTTANLSAIFEMANYKTIAIDLDMRRPTLDKLFSIEDATTGISSYLTGESNLDDIIYQTKHDNLSIIPVGDIPSNPSEIILSSRLPEMIDRLREHYDYIIINSVPLEVATDSKHIMRFSDINLVLFRENYSKKSSLLALDSLLNQKKFNTMGIVFMEKIGV
ncbi:polysaccharide biosynthesis tyrosine autokinase, partial [Sulfurovum sp. bin170]|uniref:polysaccharide biosynthesis tyrosine autokinase n=1 Tax=Sulfurovum sp. bin170 TaxID=2695268 RepID=UPI0013DF2049